MEHFSEAWEQCLDIDHQKDRLMIKQINVIINFRLVDIPVILTPQSGDVDPLIGLGSSNLND